MYGGYDISEFSIQKDDLTATIEKMGNYWLYKRVLRKNGVENIREKIIISNGGRVIVNPVEPVNLPKEITNFLMLELEKPIIVEPKSLREIYINFPVEIGIFLAGRKSIEVVDIFSFVSQKYTLYGNPRNGVICRYWRSRIFSYPPECDKHRDGILKTVIYNSSDDWVEISRIVFDIFGMKIFYDENSVYSSAKVNITSEKVAETEFFTYPPKDGMTKSLELYTARKIPMVGKKFVMEWGL